LCDQVRYTIALKLVIKWPGKQYPMRLSKQA
jgi:hypothetical protein